MPGYGGQVTLPNPRTWSAGDLPTAPRLRADVAGAVAFLTQKPYFVGQDSSGTSVASATATPIPLNVELTDTWNGHTGPPATDQTTYWAPVPGWYLVDVRVPWTYTGSTATFYAGTQGLSNGAAVTPSYGALEVNGSAFGTTAHCVDLMPMQVAGPASGSGDYIQPLARQDSGSAVSFNTSSANMPTAAIRWACALTGPTGLPVPPLASVPTPITSAWLNANVRDTVNFLICPPVLKVTTSTGSVANSTLASPVHVSPATVTVDNWSGYASGTYTAPVAGRYLVAGQVNFASSGTSTWYACGITAGGSTYWGGIVKFTGTFSGGASVVKRVRLTAGQTIQLVAAQASGGTLSINTGGGMPTRMIIVWEGA